jgi:hypothetical protein
MVLKQKMEKGNPSKTLKTTKLHEKCRPINKQCFEIKELRIMRTEDKIQFCSSIENVQDVNIFNLKII